MIGPYWENCCKMKEAAAGGNLKYKNENSHLSKLIIFNIIWVREKTNSLMSHLTAYPSADGCISISRWSRTMSAKEIIGGSNSRYKPELSPKISEIPGQHYQISDLMIRREEFVDCFRIFLLN